jgi:hypothetical protein
MAGVKKPQMIRSLTGLNSGPQKPVDPAAAYSMQKGAMLAQGPDNVPAVITDQAGAPKAPAAIKEGEIIFSVESVIGAGKGDYDKGAEFLLKLHERLQEIGKSLLEENSLAGVEGSMDV